MNSAEEPGFRISVAAPENGLLWRQVCPRFQTQMTVGTFNLNNLFSRFNFQASIDAKPEHPVGAMTIRFEFKLDDINVKTFMGKLVKKKKEKDSKAVAARVFHANLDVLAIQEVEHFQILRKFNEEDLNGLYPHVVLIEGNDPRFIDVGLLSKHPIGAVTSFQTEVHPERSDRRVFGRDLLEVEVLSPDRSKRLFRLYNTHLKSHYGDDDDNGAGKVKNDTRRRQQAESISAIISRRNRSDGKYILTGDMNDAIDAVPIQAMLSADGQALVDGLKAPTEVEGPFGEFKGEQSGFETGSPAWTHRYKPSGQPPEHHLFDQIWLSPALAPKLTGGFIQRRRNLTGDGSDHDPAWVDLAL